jgi:hypothetical protein
MLRRLSAAYFAGAVGGLVTTLLIWVAGRADLTAMIGVNVAPGLTWSWIEERILWGSLWGLGYPIVARRGFTTVRTGFVLSLFPSAAELLLFLPEEGAGMLGLELGVLTPVFVIVRNGVWGWIVAKVMTRIVG